ncbi:MAG TPA: hypothetical protein VK078_01325 [Pseudogracilibacillus sp.]|nr:hypothetical protein [Pseudogracilibacillus sp.]
MVIHWKKYLVRVNEFYGKGSNILLQPKADIHAYFQLSSPMQTTKKNCIHRQTLHLQINLDKSEQALLQDMSRTTRYKIRRAKKDGLTISYTIEPDSTDVKAFSDFYNSFARAKGIESCKDKKLIALMESKQLIIMSVYQKNGLMLASSAIIANNKTAIGLYTASARFAYREISGQLMSRANRYLHWGELIYFKDKGFHTFDLMSLTIDKNNTDHQKVNHYKRSFGGEERYVYQSFIPQSVFGVLSVWGLKILWRNNSEIIKGRKQTTVKQLE